MKPPNDEELLLEFLNLFLASVNWTTSPLLPLPVSGQDTQLLAWLGPHLRGPGVQRGRAASQEQGASSLRWKLFRPDTEPPQTCECDIFV